MAFERIGLGGVLTFDEKRAVIGMGRASRAFSRLKQDTKLLGRGLGQVGRAMGNVGIAALPLTLGLFKAAKSAVSFEQSMADLGAVARASTADMEAFETKAKEMGIVTAYSATESAEAMKLMKMAGAENVEVIGGIRGVLDAAAAGNIDYAESAEIVSTVTRGMGRSFSETRNLADILALAQTKANVTISTLGESFRYGMAQARTMGIETEELTAIFGKLGDAGLKGSMGGTALTNMLVKLASPSREASKQMEKWGIGLTDASGKLLPISSIVDKFSKKLSAVQNATERARIMTEMFGVRGQKAYAALAAAGKESTDTLVQELQKASDGIGAASEMAQKRLSTLTGRLKMMGATLEGLSIEFFGPLLDGVTGFVDESTSGLNDVLFSLTALQSAQKEGHDIQATATKLSQKHGETSVQIALGLLDTMIWLKKSWNGLIDSVKQFGSWLEKTVGKDGIRSFVALIGKIGATLAVVGPLLIAFKGLGWILSGTLIPAIKGLGLVIKVAMGPWGLIIGAATLLLMQFVDSIEEVDATTGKSITKWRIFGEDVGLVLGGIKAALVDIIGFIAGVTDALMAPLRLVGLIEEKHKGLIKETFGARVTAAPVWGGEVGLPPLAPIVKAKAATEELAKGTVADRETRKALQLLSKQAEAGRRGQELNVNINNQLNIDGREVSSAVSRHQQQIQQRAGFKAKPWAQRMAIEHGAMPATVSVRSS